MRALLDVNVLLALLDASHVEHADARAWWSSERKWGWATCPLTQHGFVRVLSLPSYPNCRPLTQAIALLTKATEERGQEFWSDDIEIIDAKVFEHGAFLGPKQVADIHLLALATGNGGRLVTFDKSVPLPAVRAAKVKNYVVI